VELMVRETEIRRGAKRPHLSMQPFQRQQCRVHPFATHVVPILSGF
jgi:hypothetical protein